MAEFRGKIQQTRTRKRPLSAVGGLGVLLLTAPARPPGPVMPGQGSASMQRKRGLRAPPPLENVGMIHHLVTSRQVQV